MAAPKNPNTANATKARLRRGQETMATKLRAAGWTVTPPEQGPPSAVPAPRPPADRTPFSERKPYVVADNLDDLKGPTSGVITLPRNIDWSGTPQKNLDTPGMLASVYETILNEASKVADLNALLNRDKLVGLWPDLYLPAKVRRLWQERFPQLPSPQP